jgi:filamentous hemagglutinin family protein
MKPAIPPNIRLKTRKSSQFRLRLLPLSIAACFLAEPAWSLPTGGQVTAGSAVFNQVGNTLAIANTPGTIINWNSFSIGVLEAVRFDQQSSLSSVLNRVTGNSSSSILGALSSNGRVFLLNPNGILFGAGSRIDVHGLIASTLNLSDQDFLAGRLNFTAGNTAGSIRNAGTLQASPGGSIYLIAPDIENSGIVRAPNGEVILAAGREVSLVDGAHPDIQVVVSAPEDKAVNLGDIAGGKVSVFGALLRQRGIVSADTVETDAAGRIVFRASKQLEVDAGSRTTANGATGGTVVLQTTEGDTYVRGTVAATGSQGTGGTIAALGNRVAVMGQAVLDASGETGGGRVMVGGDYQGGTPAVQNALVTYFGPETTLRADAGKVGAGGTVIVWADDTTRAYGNISAHGGSQRGNGGFVETSGKRYLDVTQAPDVSSRAGYGGTWLLDPYDITIGTSDTNSASSGNPLTFTGTGVAPSVAAATINAALDAGINVIIDTTGAGAETGDIWVSTAITKTNGSNASLTLNAHGDITLNSAGISSSAGTLNVTLLADQDNNGTGSIALNSESIVTNGGNVSLTGQLLTSSGSTINAGAGNVSITTKGSGSNSNGGTVTATSLTINNADYLYVPTASISGLTASGTGQLAVGGSSSAIDIYSINKSGARVDVTAYGNITQTGAIIADEFRPTSTHGDVTLNSVANTVNTLYGTAYGSAAFKNTSGFGVSYVADYGGIALTNTSSGSISTFGDSQGLQTPNGDISITGNLVNGNTAYVTLGSAASPNHTLTVQGNYTQGNGGLTLYGTSPSNHGSVSVTGTANLGGTITLSGSPTSGSYTVLNAGSVSGTFTSVNPSATATASYSGTNVVIGISPLYTWTGTTNNLWLTASNWDSGIVPDASTSVELGNSIISLGSAGGAAKNINCSGNCSLSVYGGLSVAGNASLYELLLGTGGAITGTSSKSLTVNGNFYQDAAATISGFNHVVLSSSGGLSLGNISTSWTGNYSSGSSGVIDLTSSTGSISQQSGTTLSGSAIRAESYSGILLTEANPTGVVAGHVTSTGDFKYKSTSSINVTNVDGLSGINVPGIVKLESSYSGSAFTQTAPIIASGGLLLVGTGTNQSVALTNSSNNFDLVAASLSSASTVEIKQGGSATMTVDTVDSVNGLTAPGATKIKLENAYSSGTLTIAEPLSGSASTTAVELLASGDISISQPISAKSFSLRSDGTLSLGSAISATNWVQLANYSTGSNFNVESTCASINNGCIESGSFGSIEAPTGIVFGNHLTSPTGVLTINDPIATTSFYGTTKPALVALLSGTGSSDNIAFGSAATITLPATGTFLFNGYNITNSAGSAIVAGHTAGYVANNAVLYFSSLDTSVDTVTLPSDTSKSFAGLEAGNNLMLYHGTSNYFTNGGGTLKASALTFNAGSIGTSANPLTTQASSISFTAQKEGIFLTNNASASGALTVSGTASSSVANGTVTIDNYGPTTIGGGGISAYGSIAVTTHSPLTVSGTVSSSTGSVSLASSGGDSLSVNASVSASTGVSLTAGSGGVLSVASGSTVTTSTGSISLAAGSVSGSGTVGGVPITSVSFTNNAPVSTGGGSTTPTLDACVANPALSGCSSVLPTVDACVTNPTASGCSAVLPSLSTCTTAPSTPGCSVVLPTVDACIANPSASGCSSVLPTLSTCTTAPSTPGCSVVLPTVDACVANPTAAGCTSVLPTLSTCTTAPSTPGCSVVLPTVDVCIVSPSTIGCASVLPTVATCTTAPATPGCSAVLPTLSTCTTAPSTPGCSAVLPSVSTCMVAPSTPGCSSVLPTLSACTTAPTTPGCSAVLPSLSTCTTTPSTPGCTSVLPTLSTCTTAPTTPGCSAVLPSPDQTTEQQLACLADPNACTGGTPSGNTQNLVGQVQSSEQQIVLNSQTGQSDSGRPDLNLLQNNNSSGGGGNANVGSAGSSSGNNGNSSDGNENGEQTGQTPQNNNSQGNNNATNRYCK